MSSNYEHDLADRKATGFDSGGLGQIVAPHSGQSAQLFLEADDGDAQFLAIVARSVLVSQRQMGNAC